MNVVRLFEVINDPSENQKIYLVMEFLGKGALLSKNYWKKEIKSTSSKQFPTKLTEEKAKSYFREFFLGLDYSLIFLIFIIIFFYKFTKILLNYLKNYYKFIILQMWFIEI